jgi:DnaK suppressor protein
MSAQTSKSTVAVEHLRTELAAATARLAALETEYAALLADPDTIQEDRDSTRILLEATRAVAESAQEAVHRVEQGTYGRCSMCGNAIPAERLEAIPDAETCVSCLVA